MARGLKEDNKDERGRNRKNEERGEKPSLSVLVDLETGADVCTALVHRTFEYVLEDCYQKVLQ